MFRFQTVKENVIAQFRDMHCQAALAWVGAHVLEEARRALESNRHILDTDLPT